MLSDNILDGSEVYCNVRREIGCFVFIVEFSERFLVILELFHDCFKARVFLLHGFFNCPGFSLSQ